LPGNFIACFLQIATSPIFKRFDVAIVDHFKYLQYHILSEQFEKGRVIDAAA